MIQDKFMPCENNYAEIEERRKNWIKEYLTHEVTFFKFLQKIFPAITENDNMLFRDYEHGRFSDWKVKNICEWMDNGFDEIIYMIGDSTRENELKEKLCADFYQRHCYQY